MNDKEILTRFFRYLGYLLFHKSRYILFNFKRFIVNEIDLCYKMKLNGPKSYSNTKVVSKEECMRLKKKERAAS